MESESAAEDTKTSSESAGAAHPYYETDLIARGRDVYMDTRASMGRETWWGDVIGWGRRSGAEFGSGYEGCGDRWGWGTGVRERGCWFFGRPLCKGCYFRGGTCGFGEAVGGLVT